MTSPTSSLHQSVSMTDLANLPEKHKLSPENRSGSFTSLPYTISISSAMVPPQNQRLSTPKIVVTPASEPLTLEKKPETLVPESRTRGHSVDLHMLTDDKPLVNVELKAPEEPLKLTVEEKSLPIISEPLVKEQLKVDQPDTGDHTKPKKKKHHQKVEPAEPEKPEPEKLAIKLPSLDTVLDIAEKGGETIANSEIWQTELEKIKSSSAKMRWIFKMVYIICTAIMYVGPSACVISPFIPTDYRSYFVCFISVVVVLSKILVQLTNPKRKVATSELIQKKVLKMEARRINFQAPDPNEIVKLKCFKLKKRLV